MKRITLVALALTGTACGSPSPPTSPPTRVPTQPRVAPDTLVRFAAGSFTMGHPGGMHGPYGQSWYVNELPPHPVTLRAFKIDRAEVTVARYALFLTWAGGAARHAPAQPIVVRAGAEGVVYSPVPGTEQQAMRQVTWYDARAFCAWTGGRLPTEAEWERAARGADATRTFPWGMDGPTCARAVFFTGNVACAPSPLDVGTRPRGATPDGVHDLAGNVAEWIGDWYGSYSGDPQSDPQGPSEGVHKVVRGGGYRDVAGALRTTARWGASPDTRSEGTGMRCVYDDPE